MGTSSSKAMEVTDGTEADADTEAERGGSKDYDVCSPALVALIPSLPPSPPWPSLGPSNPLGPLSSLRRHHLKPHLRRFAAARPHPLGLSAYCSKNSGYTSASLRYQNRTCIPFRFFHSVKNILSLEPRRETCRPVLLARTAEVLYNYSHYRDF